MCPGRRSGRARTAGPPYAVPVKPLLVLACAGLLVTGCSSDGAARVQTAEVGRANVAELVEAPGSVAARATAALTAPADATVEAVLVEDGATVETGAVLVRLSSPAAQQRLQQALAARAGATTTTRIPRADLRPMQDQLDAAARSSFDAGRAAAAQISDPAARAAAEQAVARSEQQYAAASRLARSSLEQVDAGAAGLQGALTAFAASQRAQADAAVEAARAAVEALTVRAPMAGVVTLGAGQAAAGGTDVSGLLSQLPSSLQGLAAGAVGGSGAALTTTTQGLLPGTRVSSGAPLLTVTDLAGLSVVAEVDETDVLLVATGIAASVQLDAVPDAVYQGRVEAVDVAPTTSAGGGVTYRVRLALGAGRDGDGAAPRPRPGMSAVVALQVKVARDVVAVASAAVLRDGGGAAVFVVADGTAERREVRLGAEGDDRVEVTSGVRAGERVVVRDVDRLRDGQAVTS